MNLNSFFESERSALTPVLSSVFGFHLLQIGCSEVDYASGGSPIKHHLVLRDPRLSVKGCILNKTPQKPPVSRFTLFSQPEAIALRTHSVDAVVVAHALEMVAHPLQVFQELDRILIPGGSLIVLGFHLASVLKLGWHYHRMMYYRGQGSEGLVFPWCLNWVSLWWVMRQLRILNYEICLKKCFFNFLGSVYLVFAKKVGIPLTPLLCRKSTRLLIQPQARLLR